MALCRLRKQSVARHATRRDKVTAQMGRVKGFVFFYRLFDGGVEYRTYVPACKTLAGKPANKADKSVYKTTYGRFI